MGGQSVIWRLSGGGPLSIFACVSAERRYHQGMRSLGVLVVLVTFIVAGLPCPVLSSPQGKRLDLGSTTASVRAPRSGEINVGGTVTPVVKGQLLTPAQYMALRQSIRGEQLLQLNQGGAAIGGQIRLSGNTASLKAFTLPPDVTAIVASRSAGHGSQGSFVIRGLADIKGDLIFE